MSGDTCLCPASGAKPKLSSFKGGGLGNKYVQLNVGGSLYYTTVRALTRHDTMLKAMFSGRMEVLTDSEGKSPCQPLAVGSVSATAAGTEDMLMVEGSVCSKDQKQMGTWTFVLRVLTVCREP